MKIKDVYLKPYVDRFWEKVTKTDDCWLWTGAGVRYGSFRGPDKTTTAHRFSYELHHGPIENGAYVCHTCDNPKCVNPDHLFLGTQSDNLKDMTDKGRRWSKIDEEDVRIIRYLYERGVTYQKISEIFPICKTQVGNIIRGEKWGTVE